MRIIRFLDEEGRERHGEPNDDGTATVILDPLGALGRTARAGSRDLLRNKRALVADDDENMRQFIQAVLARAGCSCTVCGDGAAALEAIEREPLDLIVADIMMPHCTGYDVYAAARRRRHSMPVVLVTGFGYDPDHSLVRATREGLRAVLYKPFTPRDLLEEVDRAIREATLRPEDAIIRTEERLRIGSLLAPLVPANLVCVGRNYAPAGDESWTDSRPADDDLEVFLKPTTAVQDPGGPIRVPNGLDDPQLDVEGELAIVIGALARDVERTAVDRHVLGYTAATDVTARRFQRGGPPIWMRGKGFDTFCPIGPAIVTAGEIGDPAALVVTTLVNGRAYRSASVADMVISVPDLVSALSRRMTLAAGTVILTGAPPIVHPGWPEHPDLRQGDAVAVEIQGIGRLTNRVEHAGATARVAE
jgi:2-keto-4-pentenoate hydratase/2-oxohepta-3-ene-1,7-dioic acid hydratase in catechol pathway